MWSERAVRELIRLKLRSHLLPASASGRLWAGPGAGEVCSACDEPVGRKETLYEWEDRAVGKIMMHVRCYDVWNVERVNAARE